MIRLKAILVLTAALLLAVPAAQAEHLAQVVDADATLLTLVRGSYGELFPDGSEASRSASVLALDVGFKDGEQRLLVPTTASTWPETSAKLLYDAGAGVTYLLWSAPFNGIHPMLYLTTFDGTSWGQVFEIVGTIFAPKMDLQLVVGHDSFEPADGESIRRTTIHVAWWEPRANGVEKKYTALILENGAYVGRTPSQSLTGSSTGGFFDQSELAAELVLHQSTTGSLVTGFHDPVAGEIASYQVEVLPLALSILADRVEAAALAWDPNTGVDLLATIDAALFEHGSAFHPAVLALLSAEIHKLFDEAGGDIEYLAEKFGPQVIHIGMTVGANGLVSHEAIGLMTILPNQELDFISPRHDLKIAKLGRWAVPGDVGKYPELLLSRDGGDALVAWLGAEGAALNYRETLADGSWSELQSLQITEGFPVDAALGALADHIRDR